MPMTLAEAIELINMQSTKVARSPEELAARYILAELERVRLELQSLQSEMHDGDRPWRVVLGIGDMQGGTITRETLRALYARQAFRLHPDYGGTKEQMAELNRAYKRAQTELGFRR